MTYNLIYDIALLTIFAFTALQVQGSGFNNETVPVYEDSCIIGHFGETDSLTTLERIVLESSMDKVVDAFIDCPRQMCEVYYGNLKSKSFEELDDLVKFVRYSEKINQFYSALRSFSPTDYQNKIDLTCYGIYVVSFLYDIPREYYLDELKGSVHIYLMAVLEKSKLCKTPESKNEVTEMLNDLIVKLYGTQNSELPIDYEYLSYYIRLTIKLMNNENVPIEEFESNDKCEIVLLALIFNRYDLAERAAHNSSSIDLDLAKDFLNDRAFKGIEDKERAIEILKKLLPNDDDRSAINEFLI